MAAGEPTSPAAATCGLYSRSVLPAPLRLLQLHARGGPRRSDRGVPRRAGARAGALGAAAAKSIRCFSAVARRRIWRRAAAAAADGSGSEWFPLASGGEFSVEANPIDLDTDRNRVLLEEPASRGSAWVLQSFHACEAGGCWNATTMLRRFARPMDCARRFAEIGLARFDLRRAGRIAGRLAARFGSGARRWHPIISRRTA